MDKDKESVILLFIYTENIFKNTTDQHLDERGMSVERGRGGEEGETGRTRSRLSVCTHEAAAEQGVLQEGENMEGEKKT